MHPFEEMRRMMENFWLAPFEEFGRWGDGFVPKVDVKIEDYVFGDGPFGVCPIGVIPEAAHQ